MQTTIDPPVLPDRTRNGDLPRWREAEALARRLWPLIRDEDFVGVRRGFFAIDGRVLVSRELATVFASAPREDAALFVACAALSTYATGEGPVRAPKAIEALGDELGRLDAEPYSACVSALLHGTGRDAVRARLRRFASIGQA